MLSEAKLKVLLELVKSSTGPELIWMSGYLAGVTAYAQQTHGQPSFQPDAAILQALQSAAGSQAIGAGSSAQTALQPQAATTAVATAPSVQKITIAYGTETGNSKKLATDFAMKAKKSGIVAKVVSLDQYRMNDLSKEEYFLTVISTQGEGEPPATAKKFYDHIHLNGFKLDKLKFGVLALGDTSYPLFCKVGEDVDTQLEKLGGERIVTLTKCDVDYQTDADTWFTQVLQKLQSGEVHAASAPATIVAPTNGTVIAPAAPAKKPGGKKIYTGTVLTNINLNDRGSKKQTHHIEIAAEDLDYQPGDSIGVVAENPLAIVKGIITLTGINGDKSISFRNENYTVFELLKKKLNITYLPERVVKNYARVVGQEIPDTKISLYDLLKIYPVKNAAQFEEVIEILEPVTPRLYSISSSLTAQNGEVHVTVAQDTFMVNDERRCGLCSDYLLNMPENTSFDFYVHKNNQFRLPEADKDVIMIGPGTGIAPFRAFLWERDAAGAGGRNWLFFGEQHFQSDFLYQTEIQNWAETGVLSKVSLAFSRDQQYKIYVQHRILEQAPELWKWIDGGAYIYICGAKDPMSKDVDYAMLQVIERFGSKSTAQAIEYLDQLKEQGRYLKDVY
jgi:sulfite reductase (NADPH) flavoprotein alpha-component